MKTRALHFHLLIALACAACSAPAAPSVSRSKPELIAGATPVAPFVAQTVASAPSAKTIIYVGASWCEPCRHFHDALQSGALDASLQGVRFIEYDLDRAKAELAEAGCGSRLIPLFALPEPDGRCSARRIEGSVKGEAAVASNIMPRLSDLLR